MAGRSLNQVPTNRGPITVVPPAPELVSHVTLGRFVYFPNPFPCSTSRGSPSSAADASPSLLLDARQSRASKPRRHVASGSCCHPSHRQLAISFLAAIQHSSSSPPALIRFDAADRASRPDASSPWRLTPPRDIVRASLEK